jgi:hypothetical protein
LRGSGVAHHTLAAKKKGEAEGLKNGGFLVFAKSQAHVKKGDNHNTARGSQPPSPPLLAMGRKSTKTKAKKASGQGDALRVARRRVLEDATRRVLEPLKNAVECPVHSEAFANFVENSMRYNSVAAKPTSLPSVDL